MLINFIGFAFLCGIGLGIVIVLVLMFLGKATLQRTKWTILGSAFLTTMVAIALTLYVLLLPSSEEQIRAQFELIPNPSHASQWFEYAYVTSSATGNCASTTIDRWFGLDAESDKLTLTKWYGHQLVNSGWQRLENIGWQKDDSQGVFTISTEVFMDTTKIDSQQWFYIIPNDALKQAANYSTAYVLRLSLRARCRGQ